MSKRYFIDDLPKCPLATGSRNPARRWEAHTRIAGIETAEFVYGFYESFDVNEQSSLDVWASRGGGVTRDRWLATWGAGKAPASLVAYVQAG